MSATLILHVDDYAPSRYARTRALRDAGYTVIEETTGEGALRAAQQHHPALVILDVNLPDMSGLEVCRAIKGDPITTHVLVLHVSATAIGIQSRLEGLENGADSYLTEPVESDELLAHVAALLRLRQAEQRLQQAHATLATVIDAAPLPIVALGQDRTVMMWNRAAERVFGRLAASVHGTPWPSLDDPRTRALRERLERVHDTGAFTGFETVASREDGTELHVNVSVAPVHGSGFDDGLLLMYEDITARKQAEAQRTRALADAEIANRAKDEFLAVLSHELRTPLNAVLGWIRMLRRGEVEVDRSAHALAVIERNAVAQVRLIEDILDVSRIVSGKLPLVPVVVDLLQIASTALEAVLPQADAKHLTLEVDLAGRPVYVNGDAHRLEQIVGNLLNNAVKFTEAGGTVRVALREDHAGWVRLTVEDSGAGIDPAFLPFVFERFSQGNTSATRQHGGLGLGLAIVRHLVEIHGGTVAADSRGLGCGSTFTVMLPTTEAEGRATVRREGDARALQGVRAFVVDDHDDSREMLVELLRTCGAEVASESCAADALHTIDAFRPDVIMADLGMPGEDGYVLLERVRNWFDPSLAATPIIAVSGYVSGEDRARTTRAGFAAHVGKPVDAAELIDAIRVAVAG